MCSVPLVHIYMHLPVECESKYKRVERNTS